MSIDIAMAVHIGTSLVEVVYGEPKIPVPVIYVRRKVKFAIISFEFGPCEEERAGSHVGPGPH